jgi:hypothetical protein
MEASVLTSKLTPGAVNRIKVEEVHELLTLRRHSKEAMEKRARVFGIDPVIIHSLSKHWNSPEIVNGAVQVSEVIWIDDLSVYRQQEAQSHVSKQDTEQ